MKSKKGVAAFIVLIITVFSFFFINRAARSKPNSGMDADISVTPSAEGIDENAPTGKMPVSINEIRIYTINPNNNKELVPVTVIAHTEAVTPQLITDFVMDSLEDAYFFVKVNEVLFEDGVVVVDFAGDAPPCQGISADIEEAILDSFAQSLADNIEDCGRVIFRTDGSFYRSDNKSYTNDYIHLGR